MRKRVRVILVVRQLLPFGPPVVCRNPPTFKKADFGLIRIIVFAVCFVRPVRHGPGERIQAKMLKALAVAF